MLVFILTWLSVLLFILQGILFAGVGYLLVLMVAAWRAPRSTPLLRSGWAPRFAILIPAHNEERLLPSCLESLSRLDYPRSNFTAHVVADNCTDETALVAEQGGAKVYVRREPRLRGKGYALQWLYGRLLQTGEPHDAVVILDADTLVSPNFLRVMAARLERGERAIQAYYTVRSPEQAWTGSLRFAALAVLHYLRPQGRMILGSSAGLKGNGMVFAADIMRQHTWSTSVTEDIEFHMSLLLDGVRVTFAPDAIVWGEMPNTLAGSRSQQARWEQGRLQMARKYVPVLLGAAWTAARRGKLRWALVLLDAVFEHLIPPFSLLLGICMALWMLNLMLLAISLGWFFFPGFSLAASDVTLVWLNLWLATGLLAGQAVYVFAGLALVRAPAIVYRSLLYAPVFIVWKVVQYTGVIFRQGSQGWVRTTRNES